MVTPLGCIALPSFEILEPWHATAVIPPASPRSDDNIQHYYYYATKWTMPTFLLCIKAEVENVESIGLPEDAPYMLTVKDSAGDDTREGVVVSPLEDVELSGSRGTANFAMKWAKDSRHEASLSVQQIKGMTRSFTADDAGSFVPVVAFECRGLEPIDWQPGENFIVKGLGKTVWEDVDLSSLEWADYDEDTQESVSIMELEWKFEVYRPKK